MRRAPLANRGITIRYILGKKTGPVTAIQRQGSKLGSDPVSIGALALGGSGYCRCREMHI